jgi:hypothetical protein
MNHSPWLADDQADGFWSAMPMDVLDLAWVQGSGDSDTFVNAGDYNAATANYTWLHNKIGRPIMAETSFAGAGQDRWTTAGASAINERIASGVIGVLVNSPADDYESSIQSLSGLSSTCQ